MTLERPNIHFNASGVMTHINLAADLVTQDEGCAKRSKRHSHGLGIPCDNCKVRCPRPRAAAARRAQRSIITSS